MENVKQWLKRYLPAWLYRELVVEIVPTIVDITIRVGAYIIVWGGLRQSYDYLAKIDENNMWELMFKYGLCVIVVIGIIYELMTREKRKR